MLHRTPQEAVCEAPILLSNTDSGCATVVYVTDMLRPYLIGVCHFGYVTVASDDEAIERLKASGISAAAVVSANSATGLNGFRNRALAARTI